VSDLEAAPTTQLEVALDDACATTLGKARDWTRLSDRAAARLVFALIVFNVIDAIFTIALVRAGLAEEANPLMAAALQAGPIWFALQKAMLVGSGLAVLWFTRGRRLAQVGLVLCFVVYGALMLIHTWSCRLLLAYYFGT
jgi:Domain of unknown function (DUF5658)